MLAAVCCNIMHAKVMVRRGARGCSCMLQHNACCSQPLRIRNSERCARVVTSMSHAAKADRYLV